MKRLKGLLLLEYTVSKSRLLFLFILDGFCLIALPVLSLILNSCNIGVEELLALPPFLAIMIPSMFNLILINLAHAHIEYTVLKRNIYAFTLPVTRAEIVISRLFLPSVINIPFLVLSFFLVRTYVEVLDLEKSIEVLVTSDIMIFAFWAFFCLMLLTTFISPKECLVFMLVIMSSGFALSFSSKSWIRFLPDIDIESEAFYSTWVKCYPFVLIVLIILYLLTICIAYRLAGRREKLCAG